jgi:tryptophan-rich sensory protein
MSSIAVLVAAVAVAVGGGFLSGYLSMRANGGFQNKAYERLKKPSWQPPAWLFGPVWTALYTLMGLAAWLLWRAPSSAARGAALALYALQLALNFAWTPVFTKGYVKVALAVLVALDVVVIALIAAAAHAAPLAAGLLAPYGVWLAFATSLNAAIVRLN